MKLRVLTLGILAALAAVGGLASEAQAGGDEPDCLVTDKNLLTGREKITGSAVVTLTNFDPSGEGSGVPTADEAAATLTLKFRGQTAVFRANIANPVLTSPEQVLCDVFDAPAMTSAGQTIEVAFGIPADQQLALCLVREQKAGAKGTAVTCQSVVGLDFPGDPGTTSGTAELNIYVIPVGP